MIRRLGAALALAISLAIPATAAAGGHTSAQCEDGTAGIYPCQNIDMESFLPLPVLGEGNGNDIWGWTDPRTGREYAIMGTSSGTGFVDVTRPRNPVFVGRLPGRGVPDFLLWRDIKVVGNYAFIVSERSSSGLQVFDLRRLRNPGSTPRVFTSDATLDGFSHAHNIAVNRSTDYAYVVGSDRCDNGDEAGGLYMVDIEDPLDPTFAGCARVQDADGDDETESNNYVHDVQCVIYRGPDADYRGREICLGSNENVVAIYDVTNEGSNRSKRGEARVISTTGYPTAAYTHQGWLTPDQRYFLFGDELDEQGGEVENTTTYIMSVDDLDDPGKPKPHAHDTNSIDHNLYTHGRHVYESNYMAGLRILSYSDRSLAAGRLNEVAFFDVVPGGDAAEFAGTWSNYRFPGSGITVVSTIENAVSGLFVLRPRLGGGDNGNGGDGGRRARCGGRQATIVGTDGDDRLRGTGGPDVIVARGGDDVVNGLGDDDRICGGGGNDKLRGGSGDDDVFGHKGREWIAGGSGDDRILAGAGNDEFEGGAGFDRLDGGGGDDRLRGKGGDDRLFGRAGDDRLMGGSGDDVLRGGQGNDVLRGGSGRDRLSGGGGRDDVRQ